MVKIHKDSWHFRLYNAGRSNPKKPLPDRISLCEYVWQVTTAPIVVIFTLVATAILSLICIALLAFCALVTGSVVAQFALGFSREQIMHDPEPWNSLRVVLIGVLTIIMVLSLIVFMGKTIPRSITAFKKSKTRAMIAEARKGVAETFALWEAYLEARKKKVCPPVTFVE